MKEQRGHEIGGGQRPADMRRATGGDGEHMAAQSRGAAGEGRKRHGIGHGASIARLGSETEAEPIGNGPNAGQT